MTAKSDDAAWDVSAGIVVRIRGDAWDVSLGIQNEAAFVLAGLAESEHGVKSFCSARK